MRHAGNLKTWYAAQFMMRVLPEYMQAFYSVYGWIRYAHI